MKVEDLTNEGTSQMYLACGRGAQGTIRALRQGLTVLEMAVSQMPGRPLSVITMKGSLTDLHHQYMVVTFQDSTCVLQIIGDKVSPVTTSGFQTNEPTLHAGLLEGDIFIQVTQRSLIQIQGKGENRKRTKWESDKGRILMACSNTRQVVIFIEGGQIVYFELDSLTGLLNESQTQFFEVEVRCIDVGDVPEGR
jgi:splicing factor 3B subunit 3